MGTGVGEAMLLGAAMGGGSAALTGGDPLKGALLGGLTGGVGSGISGALAGGAEAGALSSAGAEALSTPFTAQTSTGLAALPGDAGAVVNPSLFSDPTAYLKAHPYLAGSSALAGAVGGRNAPQLPGEYEGPLKRFRFSPETYRPAFFEEGGIASLPAGYDRMVGETAAYPKFAQGGISDLGSYSDGGRMLRGPGDGMSDNIPGVIAGKRPARLADGEFVVPADVVSHLGNGSTDAGARQLYNMMDKVRQARTGRKAQGREINPRKYMPA